ncbi:DUF4387 domain-containing protein [Actinomadura madurae]|uniref:DUF4387 domain-containing protein n=1 Tax=Actinomadura madurae TaxID=1993 RepID=A0A1I5J2M6_9ACTN|nr:DUF4387 domain-containing protein [Actinomadura madurae]SFO67104.1 protein of unknown function [Actinomadura madurae]SPT58617.1 Uncharacterised protein [Actinomadura madurae]
MTTPAPVLSDFAHEIRSKNAGPFWTTFEAFMLDATGYAIAADPDFLNEAVIAELYDVDAGDVLLFRIPSLNVVKISFPRKVPAGGLLDRDLHCGQQHVPLATLPVPDRLLAALETA